MLVNKSHHGLIKPFFVFTAISFSMLATNLVHAEQYCKLVDKAGNATYTLAPDKGCNTKKFKTVAINHHITPPDPASTTTATSNAASAPAQSASPAAGTATPANAPAVTPPPAANATPLPVMAK